MGDESQAQTGPNVPVVCSEACAVCCGTEEAARLAQIQAESGLRNRALTLSSIVTCIFVAAHIWFSFIGKVLTIPEIVWAIILAPWFGAAGSKIAEKWLVRK